MTNINDILIKYCQVFDKQYSGCLMKYFGYNMNYTRNNSWNLYNSIEDFRAPSDQGWSKHLLPNEIIVYCGCNVTDLEFGYATIILNKKIYVTRAELIYYLSLII